MSVKLKAGETAEATQEVRASDIKPDDKPRDEITVHPYDLHHGIEGYIAETEARRRQE